MTKGQRFNGWRKWLVAALAIGFVAVIVWGFFSEKSKTISLTEMERYARAGQVSEVTFDRNDNVVTVKFKGSNVSHDVNYPDGLEAALYGSLKSSGVKVQAQGPSFLSVVGDIAFVLFICFITFGVIRGLKALSNYDQRHKVQGGNVERPSVRFKDVQGVPEVVERLESVKDFILDPKKYQKMGAAFPKGVLLYGPPGTGKTLLARATAGECDVPFYAVSGAQLMNMFLGGSAANIRKLFKQASAHDAAIVFIDEIDAIGSKRTDDGFGGDKERSAALTQLLACMDGFGQEGNVFVFGATNDEDCLDPALIRAGRFDHRIFVGPPDMSGRQAILKVHTAGKPLADDVDLAEMARQSIGFVGADLANLVNEAAVVAANDQSSRIEMRHFRQALETIQVGPERKGIQMSDRERKIAAHHEAGHALAALTLEGAPKPYSATIIPRAKTGGHVRFIPDDESSLSMSQLKATLVVFMAGLAGEKMFFKNGDFTTGPGSDRKKATEFALMMVCEEGMGTYNTTIPISTWMRSPQAARVEREVEDLLDQAERQAIELLIQYKPAYDALVVKLLEEETIDAAGLSDFAAIPPLSEEAHERMRAEYKLVLDSVRTDEVRAFEEIQEVPSL